MNWKFLPFATRLTELVANGLGISRMKISSTSKDLVQSLKCERLYHPKKGQYDEYEGDNKQGVDPTAGLWDARAYVSTEKAESP